MLVAVVASLTAACGDHQERGPQQAAQAFLDAVAAGRADDALALVRLGPYYGSEDGPDLRLVTDEVLARAVRDAPITEITTDQRSVDPRYSAVVSVTYRIGGRPVADTYAMVYVGGRWLVDEELPMLPAFTNHPEGVVTTVNGVVVPSDPDDGRVRTDMPVLPGLYRFGVDNPLLGVDHADVTVAGLHSAGETGALSDPPAVGPRAFLNESGREQVLAAVVDQLALCLDGTATDCAVDSYDTRWPDIVAAGSVAPGSTDLASTAPDWQGCRWSTYGSQQAVCVDDIYVAVPATVRMLDGSAGTVLVEIIGYVADISDPDSIGVTFRLPGI